MLCISNVYNLFHVRECGPRCCQDENRGLYVNTERSTMLQRKGHSHRLYLDAKGSGLRAGGLRGGGGLCGGLEQSFEDGLRIHLRGGLRGGPLTPGARQGGGQTIFL